MKKLLINSLLFAVFAALLSPARGADTFFIFKASVAMPVEYVVLGQAVDQVVKKNLTGKELINLTLGQPLDATIAEPEKNVLAFQIAYEHSTNQSTPTAPKTKLIIWDSTKTDASGIVAVVAPLTALDYDECYTNTGLKGQGVATAQIPDGTADPSGNNKFFASTLQGAAHLSGAQNNLGTFGTLSLTLNALGGRVHFKFTDKKNIAAVDVNGIVTKGSAKTMGKPIAQFDAP